MKLRWGILSTAKIGMLKVIPAIQSGNHCEVVAISSRSLENAQEAAKELGISKAYGSYEELLADPDIDVIYNPLPNHLHVTWTIKALEAGKHVLCEKPIGLNTTEALKLQAELTQYPHLKVMEAFMYRFHPQWKETKRLIESGTIGEVKNVQSFFSYFNANPDNIRNQADIGGGALMDIGCYCISFPRFIFEKEPTRVIGVIDRDPVMVTDRITSGILDFEDGLISSFTCSTQLHPFQRTQIVGTKGRIEIEVPVNAAPNQTAQITLFTGDQIQPIEFYPIDQYTLESDAFALSILNEHPTPTPFEDAIGNMKVIDAIFKSAETNHWEPI